MPNGTRKRAQLFAVCKLLLKIAKNVSFNIASEASYVYIFHFGEFCGQTVLPELLLLIGQKLVENAKYQNGQNLANLNIFGIFNELLSIQNVNVARFARNVEWDIFGDFQTLCESVIALVVLHI